MANVETNSVTAGVVNDDAGTLPGIRLDHRIGLVSFREPKPGITGALGAGVPEHLPNGESWRFYPRAALYVAYAPGAKGKQPYAALIMTRSARYETRSGVGVGSTLRRLRSRIRVHCYGGRPTSCQHERGNINLPFTVFDIGPTGRVVEVAVVSGGD